jgi:TolB-like protein/Tfp pilus assembly protein PilF
VSIFAELKRRNVFRVGIAYVVTAWLVLQVADIVLDNIEAPHWLMQAIMLLLAIGLPLALVFAWAFELTPEGLKKEKDVDRAQSITHVTGRKLDRSIIVILALALGYFAWDKFSAPGEAVEGPDAAAREAAAAQTAEKDQTSAPAPVNSIAVLPFVDMSPARDNAYFTDGLTEELLNILAQIKDLQVAGRTSSFAFKDKTEDLREIGNKLNVNTLLEGSVRKDDKNQRIRVTVQLINVKDGFHIWSDTYDRGLDDIFAIQEDIARQVADALKVNLLGQQQAPIAVHARTGISAYELYLQGLQSLNLYTFESLREARRLFTESLAIDPDYLPTRLALARSWIDLSSTGAVPAPEAVANAGPLLDAVLQADPGNSDAHTFRGELDLMNDDPVAASKSFEQALAANPRNSIALKDYGRFLFDAGHSDEGLDYLRRAARIEPYDMKIQWELCVTQAFMGEAEGTRRECDRIGEIQPGNPMQFYGTAYYHLFRGDLGHYIYWNLEAMKIDPDDNELAAGVALAWMDLGDMQQASAWLQRATSLAPEQAVTVGTRIQYLLQTEQYQQALGLARKAYEEQLPGRQGSDRTISRLLVGDALQRRDFDLALKILRGQLPKGIGSPLEADNPGDANTLASMALVIRMRAPESDEADALLARAEELNRMPGDRSFPFAKFLQQATIDVARNDKAAAVSALHGAYQAGWRLEWRDTLHNDFRFKSLHQEPDYQRLVAMLEENMQEQRQEAYTLLGMKP